MAAPLDAVNALAPATSCGTWVPNKSTTTATAPAVKTSVLGEMLLLDTFLSFISHFSISLGRSLDRWFRAARD